jgi:hypothetical protein
MGGLGAMIDVDESSSGKTLMVVGVVVAPYGATDAQFSPLQPHAVRVTSLSVSIRLYCSTYLTFSHAIPRARLLLRKQSHKCLAPHWHQFRLQTVTSPYDTRVQCKPIHARMAICSGYKKKAV